MEQFSVEDLIRYIYKETSTLETAAIEAELKKNWSLREKLAVLQAAGHRLNTLEESPRTEVVLSILRYAAITEGVKL